MKKENVEFFFVLIPFFLCFIFIFAIYVLHLYYSRYFFVVVLFAFLSLSTNN